ncbi:MAG TPA: polyhydroxyalkanoate synthesis repressor PhaR, partial [Blastocatellia bacterium]
YCAEGFRKFEAARKGKMAKKKHGEEDAILIKRYGNRRLYNTETSSYINYQELAELIRAGNDVRVIDSKTGDDVTKSILIQLILEEEKSKNSLLPERFLFQLIRSQEESLQDFFTNYLSASFDAYMKTKQEFDRRFKGWLEMSASAPQIWEKFIPGAEAVRDFWGINRKDEDKEK